MKVTIGISEQSLTDYLSRAKENHRLVHEAIDAHFQGRRMNIGSGKPEVFTPPARKQGERIGAALAAWLKAGAYAAIIAAAFKYLVVA